jgi:hypothetical protein
MIVENSCRGLLYSTAQAYSCTSPLYLSRYKSPKWQSENKWWFLIHYGAPESNKVEAKLLWVEFLSFNKNTEWSQCLFPFLNHPFEAMRQLNVSFMLTPQTISFSYPLHSRTPYDFSQLTAISFLNSISWLAANVVLTNAGCQLNLYILFTSNSNFKWFSTHRVPLYRTPMNHKHRSPFLDVSLSVSTQLTVAIIVRTLDPN